MKKILLMPDAAAGAGTPPPGGKPQGDKDRLAQLESENALLKAQVNNYETQKKLAAQNEKLIAQKVAAGLTRDQAIAVIQRQKDHAAAIEALWARRRPAIVEVLKSVKGVREQRDSIRAIDASITADEVSAARKMLETTK